MALPRLWGKSNHALVEFATASVAAAELKSVPSLLCVPHLAPEAPTPRTRHCPPLPPPLAQAPYAGYYGHATQHSQPGGNHPRETRGQAMMQMGMMWPNNVQVNHEYANHHSHYPDVIGHTNLVRSQYEV